MCAIRNVHNVSILKLAIKMSISRAQFNIQSLKFVERCRHIEPEWTLSEFKNGQINSIGQVDPGDPQFHRMDLMLVKRDIQLDAESQQLRSSEFNVIYSDSYQVPVMYFTVTRMDGSVINVEEILSKHVIGESADLKFVVNQTEHPLLFRPYYMIHPCRTELLMAEHSKLDPEKYLVCWLSTIGLALGLKLDNSLGFFRDSQ